MRSYAIRNFKLVISAPPSVPPHTMGGFAKGDDVITIERREDGITDEVGADGQMSVALSADKSGSIKVKLAQTSKTNKVLDRIMNLAESINGVVDFAPIFIVAQDLWRQDAAAGAFGYIKKKATMTRGAGLNTQEWEIVVERLDLVFGDPVFTGAAAGAEAASL